MDTALQQIIDDLNVIKVELHQIRKSMPDKELFLTVQEAQLLEDSFKHEKEGTLLSGESLRKKIGV